MKIRTCGDCGKTKNIRRFPPRRGYCLLCWRKRHRAYNRRPEQQVKARARNYRPSARFIRCRRSAQLRGILFELTREQYQTICDLPCTYCGYNVKDTGHGLDRKDGSKGYTLDNVVPACAVCNWAKHVYFTFEEMKILGKTIAEIRAARF